MSDKSQVEDEHLIADGVDEEPVEHNRRMFEGGGLTFITISAAIYAAFHMLALNGVSLSGMTGGLVNLPFLPDFPLETWNFRIVHVAGALALGFLWYSANSFSESPGTSTPLLGYLSYVLWCRLSWRRAWPSVSHSIFRMV